MTKAVIRKNNNSYKSFTVSEHAGFAEKGSDIVCAAISVMTINTMNSIDQLTEDKISVHTDDRKALMELTFEQVPSSEAKLLMDSYLLGLQEIQKKYAKYFKLEIKEV